MGLLGLMGTAALTETQWEALTEYNASTRYVVAGVGTYLGATLQTAAPWAPRSGDYYVSKSGSDANDGLTPATAKLTIWGAFNAVPAAGGVTVWVDAGTYTENVAGGYFLFAKTFTNMVTIRGIPGTLPIIQNSSGAFVILSNGSTNVRFRNLEVRSTAGVTRFVQSTQPNTNLEFVECKFYDNNARGSCFNLSNASNNGIAIKRCIFESNGSFQNVVDFGVNQRIIGNTFTAVSANNIFGISGTTIFSSNVGAQTTLSVVGGQATNVFTINANTLRNIVHTGGTTLLKSTLQINRNTITAPSSVRGIAISGYTVGGQSSGNTVSSLGDTAIGWPIDGGTSDCSGHLISNNTITANGTNCHAILVSTGGSNATVSGNTTNASGGGSYGAVIKGSGHTVSGNTFTGGTLYGLLIKDCDGATFTSNTINQTVGASSEALRFAGDVFKSRNNTVTGNTFNVSSGFLYNQTLAEIGVNNVVNNNRYLISGSATWGSLLGASVSSLANVQARWAGFYDVTTNDNASVAS